MQTDADSLKTSRMVPGIMVNACILVIALTGVMCFVVYTGYFQTVAVELGASHYAEKVHPVARRYIPRQIHMPLNTAVNIGYVVIGAAWCAYTSVALVSNQIGIADAKMFYMFNIASCCYGPIQMLRILTQAHGFAVLDQWYTLPFFMLVFIWGLNHKHGWKTFRNLILVIVSILSYHLVFYHEIGFEICLGIHIALALLGAHMAWLVNSQAHCTRYFVLAMLSCLGFVVLKLLDLHLVSVSPVFRYVSGHFLSKICDVMQIHFVNNFFQQIAWSAMANSKKKKE